jgi:hypothetical protein
MRGVRAMLAAFTAAGLLILTVPSARADTVTLAPYVAGSFTGGDGVNSHWVQVNPTWRPTGISNLADADVALGLPSSDPRVLHQTDAVLSTVNVGNQRYNTDWGAGWGVADLVPLSSPTDTNPTDYAGRVWGYIAVTTPGAYNFGVLADDGFRFTLFGAGGGSESMALDGLHPRTRKGFGNNLELGTGLYYFDLIGYNHLEAGVLNLGWWQGPKDWAFATIPQANLFTDVDVPPVPLPATLWLMMSGLLGLLGLARRRTVTPPDPVARAAS